MTVARGSSLLGTIMIDGERDELPTSMCEARDGEPPTVVCVESAQSSADFSDSVDGAPTNMCGDREAAPTEMCDDRDDVPTEMEGGDG